MGFQVANFTGNWTLMWCNISLFRVTSRIRLIFTMPGMDLFDSTKSRQFELNWTYWRSGRQLGVPENRRGVWENFGNYRFDQFPGMGRLAMSNVATQFSLRTKKMGPNEDRFGRMTILNNSWHFLVRANLSRMAKFRVGEQFLDASVKNGSISNILPSIDSSSIDGWMIHVSSLRSLASLGL